MVKTVPGSVSKSVENNDGRTTGDPDTRVWLRERCCTSAVKEQYTQYDTRVPEIKVVAFRCWYSGPFSRKVIAQPLFTFSAGYIILFSLTAFNAGQQY